MIVCIGNIFVDVLIKPLDKFPAPGQQEVTEHMSLSVGGCASNPAVALARTGSKSGLLGIIGDDSLGEYVLGELRKLDIGTEGIKVAADSRTPACLVSINSKGERSFVIQCDLLQKFDPDKIDRSVLTRAKHLHYGGFFTMTNLLGDQGAKLFKDAKDAGLTTSMDTAWDHQGIWMNSIKPVLKYVDYLMTNEIEGQKITAKTEAQDIAGVLHAEGAQTVIVKLGEKGCYYSCDAERYYVPAYKVDAVDFTGAGDSFAAGFMTGLIRKKLSLRDSCRLGNVFGALSVMEMGATSGIKSFAQVLDFVKKNDPSLGRLI